jgi:tetratricopeptide (TPR) repeat protein
LPRSFVLLGVIFLYELFFGSLKAGWKKMLPLFLLGGAIGIFMLSQITYRLTSLKEIYYMQPGTDSLLTKVPTSLFRYFQLIFWPNKLTLYQTEMFFNPLEYGLAVIVFLIYAGSIVYFYRKNKLLAFWLLFFLVPLLPTLTPLRIAWAVAERYDYIGYLGIFVVAAYIFYKLSELKNIRITVYSILGIILFFLSLRTITRNQDWQSEESLWLATAKVSPSGPNIHNNLGAIYQRKGEVGRAIEEFKLAIAINPSYGDAYFNLGNMYYQTQQWESAVQSYQKAVELNPLLWQAHQNLASLYFNQGWQALAKAEIQKALELNPGDANLQQGLSLIENGAPAK